MPKKPKKPAVPVPGPVALSPAGWPIVVAGAVLVLATVAAYHNSFAGPFHFDDFGSIVENKTIRRLWPLGEVLSRQQVGGATVNGRPFVNLSLAVNYAISGAEAWSYHVFNLLVHVLAGLTLFGVVRRTLRQPALAAPFGQVALPLGLAVAAIWTLHPLQTESVTYIVQRTEALMGLFYLLTLYCFIRGTEAAEVGRVILNAPLQDTSASKTRRIKDNPPYLQDASRAGVGWLALSFVACALGMASKEVMVSAPLLVFLYDRTFVAGTFKEAWRRRRIYYGALACTWLLLFYLVAGTGSRGGTAGVDNTLVSPWNYALTQAHAVVHYLRLSAWPRPLVFDYGTLTVNSVAEVWPQGLLLLALATGTVVALWRRPVWGFLGAWFFTILAPSSSFVPIATQTIAEHRMYLSLAVPVALAVAGLHVWLGRGGWLVCAILAVACGGLTRQRNLDYRSDLALWTDTLAKRPESSRAYYNLGKVHEDNRQWPEAMAYYQQALQVQPDDAEAQASNHTAVGTVYANAGQWTEAIAQFEQALRLRQSAEAYNNLGTALMNVGRTNEAIPCFERALRLRPDRAEAEVNWATALMLLHRAQEAVLHFERAVTLNPGLAEAQLNLALALRELGRTAEAEPHYREALRLDPNLAPGK